MRSFEGLPSMERKPALEVLKQAMVAGRNVALGVFAGSMVTACSGPERMVPNMPSPESLRQPAAATHYKEESDFNKKTPLSFEKYAEDLRNMKPDSLVKGSDYNIETRSTTFEEFGKQRVAEKVTVTMDGSYIEKHPNLYIGVYDEHAKYIQIDRFGLEGAKPSMMGALDFYYVVDKESAAGAKIIVSSDTHFMDAYNKLVQEQKIDQQVSLDLDKRLNGNSVMVRVAEIKNDKVVGEIFSHSEEGEDAFVYREGGGLVLPIEEL